MATIVLVRHAVTADTGRTMGGRTDADLTDAGRVQAEDVAERLAQLRLKAVYASPLPRAQSTARAIAARQRRDVETLEGVTDWDYGRWNGRTLAQLRRSTLWVPIQQTPSRVRFPDGESFLEAEARSVAAIESLVARYGDRDVVAVVSHADIIKLVVGHYLGMPLDLFQRIVIAPASVTVVSVPRRGAPALLRCNDSGPLRSRPARKASTG